MTPPDHVRFPFDLSPNVLDFKYKQSPNSLLEFKEEWSIRNLLDDNRFYTKASGKEKASNRPSWTLGERPEPGESGKDFAKRVMDKRYGEGNYKKGPTSEYNILKKWGDRGEKNK